MLTVFSFQKANASIVVSGETDTHVNAMASGHVVVNIAPIQNPKNTGDISFNSYTDFNVLKPGVSLNNQTVDARTVINEVISNNTSYIGGQLTVLGPKAHVIIANPSGITVNGGAFVNTGGVALSTGQVSIKNLQITPITIQQNAIIETTQGSITIEGNGFSGLFTNLGLIAKQIFINGPIKNNQPLSGAAIELVAGDSLVTFDSSISTVDLGSRCYCYSFTM